MLYRTTVLIMLAVLVADTSYPLMKKPESQPYFQLVGDSGGLMALDTRTGKLCRTAFQSIPAPTPSAAVPEKRSSNDPILDEIHGLGAGQTQTMSVDEMKKRVLEASKTVPQEESGDAFLLRSLGPCWK